MDTILVALAATAAVLGLLWLAQRFMRILPGSVNSAATNARVLWAVLAIVTLSFWLNSLDAVLAEKQWTLPFCKNVVWLILLPTLFMYCVKRGFAKHPDTSPFTQIPTSDKSKPGGE